MHRTIILFIISGFRGYICCICHTLSGSKDADTIEIIRAKFACMTLPIIIFVDWYNNNIIIITYTKVL